MNAVGAHRGNGAHSPYGGGPGAGLTLPPYYRPTPSVKVAATFFPLSEEVGEDEMRVTFAGSGSFPPRRNQATTCIMVELGNGDRFFFGLGSGALCNLVALQVPITVVNDIFLTSLDVANFSDIPYLYCFAPWTGRWTPLRIHGPSGATPDEGTRAMARGLEQMTHWHTKGFSAVPVGDGYLVDVNEFDWADDGGACYDKNGVTVRHWRRATGRRGATGYRLDWHGLSFVWTGEGRPDDLTIEHARGADVFVTELLLDTGRVSAQRMGIPEASYDRAMHAAHADHYAAGSMIKQVNPRIGLVTHFPYDHDLVSEAAAGIQAHWDGLFTFGAPDGMVINVTPDAIWTREAAVPEAASSRRASTPGEMKATFGGEIPETLTVPEPAYSLADLIDARTLSHEIPVTEFVPADVRRPLVRGFPPAMTGLKVPLAMLLGLRQTAEAMGAVTQAYGTLADASGQFAAGVLERTIPNETLRWPASIGLGAMTGAVRQTLRVSEDAQRAVQQAARQAAASRRGRKAEGGRGKRPGATLVQELAGWAARELPGRPGKRPSRRALAPAGPDGEVPRNPYGPRAGAGITLPPYYRPTPSVRVPSTFFPLAEVLGPDEMRVTFAGTCPVPPRRNQAATAILVELGNGDRFFFDFGPGCLRNLIALQVPVPLINDIFLTHLHADHYGELPYLYAYGPWAGRRAPLRVHGPSGRTPDEGTTAMIEGMKRMTRWHTRSAADAGDGYQVQVNEFDWEDDGGVCYDRNGVTVRHWRRIHNMCGAVGYRLDWNGLSFVWTGDGRPDDLTIEYARGADVFVTELQLDTGALVSLKTGVPEVIYNMTIDMVHTDHYAAGYMIQQVNPRIGMVTHMLYDRDLVNEAVAGVRAHWDGLFAFGAPDGVVVNVTRDAVWTRQAAWAEAANIRPATTAELAASARERIPAGEERPDGPAARYERHGSWYMRVGGKGPDRVRGKTNLPAGARVV